jgi:hypothetical protein
MAWMGRLMKARARTRVERPTQNPSIHWRADVWREDVWREDVQLALKTEFDHGVLVGRHGLEDHGFCCGHDLRA